ncbi:hypothetical protein [Thermomonas sp. HDW16]|uniref:hypothetical protein n=1 Tax=Thermomonas sp. HDW16 TaxID=2714945 RepID=UPI001981C604|nr:hypothetical protein [Thermomonas sp. HDW16]
MFRNILLSALAATALAGCATDYAYRGGNGDYYYGQPRVEYRYYGPSVYGGYGGYYGNGLYGGVGFGYPYGYGGYGGYYGGGYWNYPYGGYPHWYRPRPPHGHGDNDHGHDRDGDRNDRKPPWRNIGGLVPPDERVGPDRDDPRLRVRRQQQPSSMPMSPMPQRAQRPSAPVMPRMRSSEGGSRMGRVIRNAKVSSVADE